MWMESRPVPGHPRPHPRCVTGIGHPHPLSAAPCQQPRPARLSVTVHDIHGNMTVMME